MLHKNMNDVVPHTGVFMEELFALLVIGVIIYAVVKAFKKKGPAGKRGGGGGGVHMDMDDFDDGD